MRGCARSPLAMGMRAAPMNVVHLGPRANRRLLRVVSPAGAVMVKESPSAAGMDANAARDLWSAVPFGPGIDIWRSCRFIGSLMRSLCMLPRELVRFVPCSIGANHCRLRHIGWEKCGHGLTSRPRKSASGPFLDHAAFSLPSHVFWCFACRFSSLTVLFC